MLTTMNISQRGSGHILQGIECQDASHAEVIHTSYGDYAVGAIADGVGSCLLSEVGSKLAVMCSVDKIKERLMSFDMPPEEECVLQMLRDAFQQALDTILEFAEDKCFSPVLMETTLTVSVYEADSQTLYYGHIGDDGIVALFADSTYRLITKRHKGEAWNTVITLSQTNTWEFAVEKNVVAVAMLTDGLLDYSVGDESHNNRVYWPFYSAALLTRVETAEDASKEKETWENRLSEENGENSVRNYVKDDLTLLVIQNQKALESIEPVSFDQEAWDEQTRLYQKQQEEALYADFLNTRAAKEDQHENYETEKNDESGDGGKTHGGIAVLKRKVRAMRPKPRKIRCFGAKSGTRYICERDPAREDTFKTNYPDCFMRLEQNPAESVEAVISGAKVSLPSAEGESVIDLVCTEKAGYIGYIFKESTLDPKEE